MADVWQWKPMDISATLPSVQDVGAMKHSEDPWSQNPNYRKWVYLAGSDGSLWRMLRGFDLPEQVPSPGGISRVAVSPDTSVWVVTLAGEGWVMRSDFVWARVAIPEEVIDVDVAADHSVWLVTRSRRYYVQRSDAGEPRYVATLISIFGITGIEQPSFEPDHMEVGRAWGVTDFASDHALIYSDGIWRPNPSPNIVDIADLSLAPSNLWMVKKDGTVWTTTDGITQLRRGNMIATRIAGDFNDCAFCVSPDGLAWMWRKVSPAEPVLPPPPPPPPPPPADPGAVRPTLEVASNGHGEETIFKLTGSRFTSGATVTIRAVRIGDGGIAEWYWLTTANGDGKIDYPIPLPCLPGVQIHFSANDGRFAADDFTERLWSNTVPATCP